MHEFAERGIASHWKYKSSEKFNSLTWKEYDWLADLVEIIDRNENPEDYYEEGSSLEEDEMSVENTSTLPSPKSLDATKLLSCFMKDFDFGSNYDKFIPKWVAIQASNSNLFFLISILNHLFDPD